MEKEITVGGLSFADMVHLYKDDPEGFEVWRKRQLEIAVEEVTEDPAQRERLKVFLCSTEMKLSRFGSGIARFSEAVNQFVVGAQKSREALRRSLSEVASSRAEIVPLPSAEGKKG